jgi:Ca-activated chloride channel family protein
VGHDVNTYLLDRLAVEGRGRVEYVTPQADVEQAMGSVLSRIDAPALTNLRIVRSPVRLMESAPAELPDLFFGEELVIFTRYRGHGTGELTIEGSRGGRRQTFSAEVRFPEHETDNAYVAPLWAARRIGELTRQIRLEGSSPTLVNEIRNLALRYGIITEYTSYLVLEPEARQALQPGRLEELAAAAPAAQSGERAFKDAKQSADLSRAKSLAAANEAVRDGAERQAEGTTTKRVSGKLFRQKGTVWTDATHTDSLQIVNVAPFSPAWFALARALPEVVPWFAAGDEVLVAGRKVSIKVTAAGATSWSTGRLEQLVKDFRGQ